MKSVIFTILSILIPLTSEAQGIYYLPGSTQKIEQLVGDFDRQNQVAVSNLTNTSYQIWGTDLGVPFEHKGKTYILFGDIPGDVGFGVDRDPIAFTEDTDPSDGIELEFLTSEPGKYKPITIPGISQGAFEVPLDGISIDDDMYVYHSTDGMTRSVLARSTDDGESFTLIEENHSSDYFVNISVNKITNAEEIGLPSSIENGIIAIGTGDYRESAIYLYSQSQDSIEYKESRYFLTGWDGELPIWSNSETDAIPIIDIDCGGEISSAYNEHLEKWMVLYNCGEPRGIQCQFADYPWGPYSESITILEPWDDDAYCNYMHTSWDFMMCDEVHDPGRENEWGGEYGPYLFKQMSTMEDSLVTIYYTLSTWNPYTTVLMETTFVKPAVSNTQESEFIDANIQIKPNPTTGIVDISWQKGYFEQVEFYHFNGQFIATLPLEKSSQKSVQLDLSSYQGGVYFVRLANERKTVTRKIVLID